MTDPAFLRLTSSVPPSADGSRLLDYLCARFPYHDRDGWREHIADGRVLLDDDDRPPAHRQLHRGQRVTYLKPHREPRVPLDVAVLATEGDLVVVDKPAGLPVHSDGPFVRHTLIARLRTFFGPNLGLTHRLDRETSGVMVLATSHAERSTMQRRFERGEVHKRYLAVVEGVVRAPTLRIDSPIATDPAGDIRLRRVAGDPSLPGARPALTEARVLRRGAERTLLEVRPRTGRTHQIRVHLAHAGHPVAGDVLYGGDPDLYLAWLRHVKAGGDPSWPERRPLPRHMLHASDIAWRDDDGSERSFHAPTPPDLAAALGVDAAAAS